MNQLNLTPRAERIIKIQRVLFLLCAFGIPYGLYDVAKTMGHPPFGMWWVPFIVGSLLAARLVFKALLFFAVLFVYQFDLTLMREETEMMSIPIVDEPPQAPREEIQLTVVSKPDAPVGHYYDAEIWEWIEFVDAKGRHLIGRFEDTINPKQMETYVIPDEHALFSPGILYKLELKDVPSV